MTNQQWLLAKEFRFEAAHKLPHYNGMCARLHGHSWRGIVYIAGDALGEHGAQQGMVIDFAEVEKYLKPLVETYLDHHYLNETLGLESPTSEKIATWVYEQLESAGLVGLTAVRIEETCTSMCLYSKNRVNGWLNSSEGMNLLSWSR